MRLMNYTGSDTSGIAGDSQQGPMPAEPKLPKLAGSRHLFERKNPGAPGKLGKSSTKAESLSKLRGKGALA